MEDLPVRPALRRCYHCVRVADDFYQLRAGAKRTVDLRGSAVRVFALIRPLLSGRYTIDEIAGRVAPVVGRAELLFVLRVLVRSEVIEDGAAEEADGAVSAEERRLYDSQLTFFSNFTRQKLASHARLRKATVSVIGLGRIGSQVLGILAQAGVGCLTGVDRGRVEWEDIGNGFTPAHAGQTRTGAAADIVRQVNPTCTFRGVDIPAGREQAAVESAVASSDIVVVALDYETVGTYEDVNDMCLRARTPWTICSAVDPIQGRVGPLFVPYETACFSCFDLRLKSNVSAYPAYLQLEQDLRDDRNLRVEYGRLGAIVCLTGAMCALEVLKHVSQFALPETTGRVCFVDFRTIEVFKWPVPLTRTRRSYFGRNNGRVNRQPTR
jgi:molybdopterin/thiamine biosynthesis adenylyltransferase